MPGKRRQQSADAENMAPAGKKRAPRQPKKATNSANVMQNIANETNGSNSSSNTTSTTRANNNTASNTSQAAHQQMLNIFDKAQKNEALHGRYCQEIVQLYDQVRQLYPPEINAFCAIGTTPMSY